MHLASPLELLIITTALFLILFLTHPLHENLTTTDFRTHYLFSAWNGNAPLSWAFWPFFLLLNSSLFIADFLAKTGVITVSSWDDIHFVLLFPLCWWTLAVWRCSKNAKTAAWQAFSRLVTLSVFFEYAVKLSIRIDYPRIFFACEDLLLDYGSCF